ncbi:MAG: flagellar motor protein [Sphingomonas fennica]
MKAAAARSPRWMMSFADICLLLLGFMVLLHAQAIDGRKLAQGMRAAFGNAGPAADHDLAAGTLFAPAEAVLRPPARARLAALGRAAAAHGRGVRIESRGTDPAPGGRLDRWELAAARTAAVARAVAAGGLREDAIQVSIPQLGGSERQHLLVAE